jgi:8-oxo-dGTP pyrophosphatase MutT (NUDIX family)
MNLFEDQGWDEPEWGFPKGRRNNKENDFDCSIREFEEETGYNASDLTMIKNIGFFEETFTGSNLKSYRHKYYLCKAEYEKTKNEDKFQKSEIGDLKWFTYEECLKRIRLYNFEKRKMLIKINNIINK